MNSNNLRNAPSITTVLAANPGVNGETWDVSYAFGGSFHKCTFVMGKLAATTAAGSVLWRSGLETWSNASSGSDYGPKGLAILGGVANDWVPIQIAGPNVVAMADSGTAAAGTLVYKDAATTVGVASTDANRLKACGYVLTAAASNVFAAGSVLLVDARNAG